MSIILSTFCLQIYLQLAIPIYVCIILTFPLQNCETQEECIHSSIIYIFIQHIIYKDLVKMNVNEHFEQRPLALIYLRK